MKAAGTWAISSSSSSSSQGEDTECRDELIAVRERIAQWRAQGDWSTSPSSTASTDSSRHGNHFLEFSLRIETVASWVALKLGSISPRKQT